MKTWWVSFAGDEGNRGVCIVDADDQGAAIAKIKTLGINPGGEAMFFEMPFEALDEIVKWGRDRLIKPEELKVAGYKKLSQCTEEEKHFIENHPNVSRVCGKHTQKERLMNNKTVLRMCIADVNELLTKALREHVLRQDNYDVVEVYWDERESDFRITLEPTKPQLSEPVRT